MKALIHTILYQPLYNLLIFLAWLVPGHSIGWAIIIITVIIRLILLPSSLKAAHAQARIQALQPKVNQLRKRHKGNSMEMNKAIMALYKEEGVSQFGACLPLLIQLPILIILYQVFQRGLNAGSLSDLYSFVPQIDAVNTGFYGLDLTKPNLWLLPILAGVTQFVLSKMTMPKTDPNAPNDDPAQMMSKQMLYIFPIINVFFARIVPSALSLYWVITTVISIFQQWYVNENIKKNIPTQAAIEEYITEEIVEKVPAKKEQPKRKDMLTKMMRKRLDKQEKKTGVTVTIRKKGE